MGKCTACGSEAYVGLAEVECTNVKCKWYVEPPAPPVELTADELEADLVEARDRLWAMNPAPALCEVLLYSMTNPIYSFYGRAGETVAMGDVVSAASDGLFYTVEGE